MLAHTSSPPLLNTATIEIVDIQGKDSSGVGRFTQHVTADSNTIIVHLMTCACGCNEQFVTVNARQKYISNKHRQHAYRTRKNGHLSRIGACLHCGHDIPSHKRKSAKYCKPGCRSLSYRARRAALITTWSTFANVGIDVAHDIVEKVGMTHTRNVLSSAGYTYNYGVRSWQQAAVKVRGIQYPKSTPKVPRQSASV